MRQKPQSFTLLQKAVKISVRKVLSLFWKFENRCNIKCNETLNNNIRYNIIDENIFF